MLVYTPHNVFIVVWSHWHRGTEKLSSMYAPHLAPKQEIETLNIASQTYQVPIILFAEIITYESRQTPPYSRRVCLCQKLIHCNCEQHSLCLQMGLLCITAID